MSAFAPICHPTNCPWGTKAFDGYLGSVDAGKAHDAVLLIKSYKGRAMKLLVDQGTKDNFLTGDVDQLQPTALEAACAASAGKVSLELRMQEGYDHSYNFISTFIADHINYHADALGTATTEPSAARPITCKAMVAFGVNDLREEEIVVAPPKAGEVRVKVLCNALCHTDIYTLSGADPEELFPSILGHEATAVVESVGPGVTSVKVGDTVVPGYTPQCKGSDCIFCMSPKTNLCPKIRGTQGSGKMPDGTSRFTLKKDGSSIFHFMGCSTFAEYTVLAEISCARSTRRSRPRSRASLAAESLPASELSGTTPRSSRSRRLPSSDWAPWASPSYRRPRRWARSTSWAST